MTRPLERSGATPEPAPAGRDRGAASAPGRPDPQVSPTAGPSQSRPTLDRISAWLGPDTRLGRFIVSASSAAAERIRRRLRPLAVASGYVRLVAWGLSRCGFTLVLAVLVYFLMVSEAGSDYLFGLAADFHSAGDPPTWWRWGGNVAWVAAWVLTGWFWSTIALTSLPFLPRSHVLTPGQDAAAIDWLKRWLPSLLAGAGGAGVAAALAWVGGTAPADTPSDRAARIVLYLAAGAVFAATVLVVSLANLLAARMRAAWRSAKHPEGVAILWRWIVSLGGTLLLGWFLVAATVDPVATSRLWGGAFNLILIACMAWIGVGTTLVLLGDTWGVPLVGFVLVWLVLVSAVSDQHREPSAEGPPPRALEAAYAAWRQAAPDPDRPLVLVAAAGGGMRAAYWTASVLGHARDAAPALANQIFAISGVSGGSVGAATYAALAAHGVAHCPRSAWTYQLCGELAVSHDLLGPTLAGYVFTDVLQGFIPTSIVRLHDRAHALGLAIAQGWADALRDGSDPFGSPLDALYAGAHPGVPELLLNGTSARTGGRVLTASVAVPPEVFPTALDARARYRLEPTLAEAAVNSARFPYVTPVGAVGAGAEADEIGDGGYFENFGAATTEDLLRWLLARPDRPRRILVVSISSDDTLPFDPPFWFGGADCPRQPAAPSSLGHVVPQLRAPVLTLLNGRSAHGHLAAWRLLQLIEATPDVRYIPFRLTRPPGEHGVPLSWSLSREGQATLMSELDRCPNQQAFAALIDALLASAPR